MREREEFDEHFPLLFLLRIMAAFDSKSSWYSAGYGWSEPFDRRSGRRRGGWREDEWYWLTCSTGNWWSRAASKSVEWRPQAVHLFFEKVGMQRGGTVLRQTLY